MKATTVILIAILLIGGVYVYVNQNTTSPAKVLAGSVSSSPTSPVAQPSSADLMRVNSANSVQVGIKPLSLQDKDGKMVFGIGLSTHSVDLSGFKLDKITRVSIDGVVVDGQYTWVPESDDPHHRSGQLKVSALDSQGKPRINDATKVLKVEISGLAGTGVRTFEWQQPLKLIGGQSS